MGCLQSKLQYARHPFLKNSKHHVNRDNFSVALKRNDSFQFFEVSCGASAPHAHPRSRASLGKFQPHFTTNKRSVS
jgi:hypothetical protein